MAKVTRKRHSAIGSRFESFLSEEGMLEETTERAIKAVIAWQLHQAMRRRRLTKKAMAQRLGTSRSQLDRLLDPTSDAVTLASLKRAARLVGKKIRMDLVDAA
jgi:predicted XRE-type DNA-binding protein